MMEADYGLMIKSQEMFAFTFFCKYCNTDSAIMHSLFLEKFILKCLMKKAASNQIIEFGITIFSLDKIELILAYCR